MLQGDILKAKRYLEQVKETLGGEVIFDVGMAKAMLQEADEASVHTNQVQVDLVREVAQLVIKADLFKSYVELAIESCDVVISEKDYYGEA